jgi:DNA-binding Lrp family transcriptional regulator
LENVFADMGAEVSSKVSESVSKKSKRSAFVFITITESDAGALALEDLRKITEVKEVYLAHGAYDVVAKVVGESFDHVREVIHKQIGNLSSVKSTLTLTLI